MEGWQTTISISSAHLAAERAMAAAPKAGRVVVTDAAQAVQRRADLGEKLAPANELMDAVRSRPEPREAAKEPAQPVVDAQQPTFENAGIKDGDILNRLGKPFTIKSAATRAANKLDGDFDVAPVEGGFVARPRKAKAAESKVALADAPAHVPQAQPHGSLTPEQQAAFDARHGIEPGQREAVAAKQAAIERQAAQTRASAGAAPAQQGGSQETAADLAALHEANGPYPPSAATRIGEGQWQPAMKTGPSGGQPIKGAPTFADAGSAAAWAGYEQAKAREGADVAALERLQDAIAGRATSTTMAPTAGAPEDARPPNWRGNMTAAAKVAHGLGIDASKYRATADLVRAIDAADAAARGDHPSEPPATAAPKKNVPMSMGTAPGNASAVTVRDGVVHLGKYEALNYDTGEPVTVPKGSTRADVAKALRDAGALTRDQKVFGLGGQAEELMFSRSPSTKVAYEARIDALFGGQKAVSGTRVLDRSDVMGLLGHPDVPLMLNERHLLDGLTNHPEMTAAAWKKVPGWLENPAAVYTDPNHPGRLTVVAPERIAGYPVVMAVEPNPTPAERGKAEPFQLLVTVFANTTGNLPALGYLSASGRLLYADTKTAPVAWQRAGEIPRTGGQAIGAKRILTEKNLAGWRKANNPAYSQSMSSELVSKLVSLGHPATKDSVRAAVRELVNGLGLLPNRLGRVVVATAAEIKSTWEPLIGPTGMESADAGQAQGFYDPASKTVFLIADHIKAGDEMGVVAHELMHKHGQAVLGEEGWNKLHGMIGGWAKAAEGSLERRVYDEAVARVQASRPEGADAVAYSSQELFPYAVQVALEMGVMPNLMAKPGTVARFLGMVKQALRQVWDKITRKPDLFNAQDMVNLAFGIAQRENPAHAGELDEAAGHAPAGAATDGQQFSRSAMKSVEANIARGREALAKAITDKTSVHRAMFRTGMGWVDFVWGDEGRVKASGKTTGAMGLAHILEARQRKDGMSERGAIDSLSRIVTTIAQGEEVGRTTVDGTVSVRVEHDGYRVVLTKNPGSNAWVVTGFELSQVRERPDIDARPPTQPASTLPRGELGADSLATGDTVPSLDRATHQDSTVRGGPAGADDVRSVSPGDSGGKSAPGRTATPTDRAVMDMAREGKSAQDVLRLVADASKSSFNRQVARLLLKTGAAPSLRYAPGNLGEQGGFKLMGKYSRAEDSLTLASDGTHLAEQMFLHEMIHAATLKALDRKGLASLQMRALFAHVQRQGGAAGQYGMKNVGEFVAEAFTNPQFQQALRRMDAPGGSGLKSAWDGFVRVLRAILGLPQDEHDALSRALQLGVAVMREDKALRGREARGAQEAGNAKADDDAHFGARPATDDYTPEQRASVERAFGAVAKQTLAERAKSMRANIGIKLRQGLVDQFAPIKEFSPKGYILARLSKGSEGAVEAALLYGKVFLRDGVYDVDIKDGGFAQVLAALKGEHDRFLQWVAALRSVRLKAEGRENLLTDEDISALKTLNQGTMADGSPRPQAYLKALQQLNAFNEAALKVGMESGLIDQAAFDLMKEQPYVPFYRIMEDEGAMNGPRFSSGLTNQEFAKKLKGGKQQINGDLLQNMLLNWSHLYAAAARNRAALATVDAAADMGVAHLSIKADKEGNYSLAGKKEGMVKVMRDGLAEYWTVEDPYLLDALSAMNYAPGGLTKAMAPFKRLLTFGVTVNPAFKIRNLIRDSLSAVSQADLSYNPLANVGKGWKLTARDSQIHASMLASGGIIKFGTQEDTNRLRHQIKRLGGTMLDKQGWGKLTGQMRSLWEAYEDFGDRTENVNRAALYERLIAKGHGHAEQYGCSAYASSLMAEAYARGDYEGACKGYLSYKYMTSDRRLGAG